MHDADPIVPEIRSFDDLANHVGERVSFQPAMSDRGGHPVQPDPDHGRITGVLQADGDHYRVSYYYPQGGGGWQAIVPSSFDVQAPRIEESQI